MENQYFIGAFSLIVTEETLLNVVFNFPLLFMLRHAIILGA